MGTARAVRRLARFAVIGALLALDVACQQTSAGDVRAASEARGASGLARSLCEADCAHAIRCEGPRAMSCDCGAIPDRTILRPDWTQAEIACLGRTGCEQADTEQACEAVAYRAIGAAPLAWPAVVMRCFERGDTCGGSSVTCRRLAAMTDDARAEAAVCFDQPCETYAPCLREFIASHVTPAVHAWR